MRVCNSCLFYDSEDCLWRFYVNDNMELMYSIMYAEDKWSKESKIDSQVVDFIVNFDINNKIYIIYSVRAGNLKYCVWEHNKWFGKTIYGFENNAYEMSELNAITMGELIHIFFIEKNNKNQSQCSLIHLSLNKSENLFNTIDTIPFLSEVSRHYEVQNLDNDNIYLIFIRREKNEVSINFVEYKSNKWSIPRRLYGITGDNINFCTLLNFNRINIMNLSKEGSLHFLEHVLIEPDGKMRSYKIHESFDEPNNFLLVEISGVLSAIWIEEKDVLTSSYENQWTEPYRYYTQLNDEISMYKYLSLNNKYSKIKCKYILGTNPPEKNLLLPPYVKNPSKGGDLEASETETTVWLESDVEENKIGIQEEILNLQKTNKNLQKKLIGLQIKYQQKLRILEETENNFFKLTNSNKKIQEKLNIIIEIQESSIKELEMVKVEKIAKDVEINELKTSLQQLTSKYEELIKQKISEDDIKNELINKLQQLTSENELLRQDLKYEKDMGIVDRLLKKRSER